MNYRLKTMDKMDACVFSSDMLYNDEERKHFEAMVARWVRALSETENVAPPQREWQGLTDEETADLIWKSDYEPRQIAIAIEAALRSKNT